MAIMFYSTKPYERRFFDQVNQHYGHSICYLEARLNQETAKLTNGYDVVCCFVNDRIDAPIIKTLAQHGVKLIALRSAGYNHVDLQAAAQQGLTVVRVPAYSPYAVAEHAVGLILSLNRKIHRAYNRVRESDFSLHGLMGFDLHGKTVGVIGTGEIGSVFARNMQGLGCEVLAFDPYPDSALEQAGVRYVDLDTLYRQSHIISLHCPLTPDTHHLIDAQAIETMHDQVMLINTSRGAIIDTGAAIEGLKNQKIGYLGLDVYEEEADLFFEDLSDQIITDDVFARLLTFPNVIVTAHQAFFTEQAMHNIADVTLNNIKTYNEGGALTNAVKLEASAQR